MCSVIFNLIRPTRPGSADISQHFYNNLFTFPQSWTLFTDLYLQVTWTPWAPPSWPWCPRCRTWPRATVCPRPGGGRRRARRPPPAGRTHSEVRYCTDLLTIRRWPWIDWDVLHIIIVLQCFLQTRVSQQRTITINLTRKCPKTNAFLVYHK